MSLITLSLPVGYPFVLLTATSCGLLTLWQSVLVGNARKAAGVPYPLAYASKEEAAADEKKQIFNCTQRAHLNTIENLPQFIVTTLVAGLSYPRAATILSGLWLVSRVLYTTGYITGQPKKRSSGAIPGFISMVGLIGTSIASALALAKAQGYAF